jgi:hypothetical protein
MCDVGRTRTEGSSRQNVHRRPGVDRRGDVRSESRNGLPCAADDAQGGYAGQARQGHEDGRPHDTLDRHHARQVTPVQVRTWDAHETASS